MRNGVRALLGLAVAATVFTTACAESATAPAAAPLRADTTATSSHLLGGLLGGVIGTVTNTLNSLLASPVKRNTPLAQDVSWTFVARPGGAVSSNSSVGLTIVVPPGAVDQYQTITVTALKGSAIAYRFEPHMEFDRKVVLTQDLRGTSAGGLLNLTALKGAHFEGDQPDYLNGQIKVTEVVPALLSWLTKTVTFGVDHFSGWIVASGYSGGRSGSAYE
ncbi:MAG TPA: hypothetical protein VEB19_01805 [Gemmatimonadaceae bacterium]|nr:hypothetical protein [Gemmatimonadaceae bacterium]